MVNQLTRAHLKKFTVKELKQEVLKVKKQFQVSKLKRIDIENIILLNEQHFKHLMKKVKNNFNNIIEINKAANMEANNINNQLKQKEDKIKQEHMELLEKATQDRRNRSLKNIIKGMMNKVDKDAVGRKASNIITEKHSNLNVKKN